MIRLIDIRLNAAHPELPLAEAVTYTGAPSTMLIRGVPGNCGKWCITSVYVAATFPDGSTSTRLAVQSANGVWVATLPATATSGRTASGVRIMADGEDENGEIVTGYILGVADFAVASLGVTPAPEPGATSWQMLYFDTVPGVLRKGDVTKIDGVLKIYNGTAWEPFAAPVTFDNAVTKDSANGVKSSGIWSMIWGALAALPTGFASLYDWVVNQLAGKASTADATLTERGPNKDGLSAWTIKRNGEDVTSQVAQPFWTGDGDYAYQNAWLIGDSYVPGDDGRFFITESVSANDILLNWTSGTTGATYTATRTALPGYQLGSQTDKPLASEAEAEELRTGKQNALSAQQLANIAAVSNALAFDATHSYAAGDPVVYNGTLYTFTSAHTGAWTGSDVSAVDIIARLAGKLDKSGGAMDITYYHGPLTKDNQIVFATSAQGAYIAFKSGGHDIAIGSDRITINGQRLALAAANPTAGNLAALDANGNPTDAGWTAGDLARYSLTTKTINNGAVSLDDRAINAVAVSSSLASLTVNFPTATSGKARDFGLRLTVASGITTAPELALPQGVTCENADGEAPEIGADGAATILYFTETAAGVFLVKGEVVTAIS